MWGMLENEQRGSVNLRNMVYDKQRGLENPEDIANMNCGHSCREGVSMIEIGPSRVLALSL